MDSRDTFDLDRFVSAQEDVYEPALAEIRAGRKRTHWRNTAEARAYLAHPILGARLLECCDALLRVNSGSANEIFASPDDLKLRSCATLFASVSEPGSVFERVLSRFFGGARDERTEALLLQE